VIDLVEELAGEEKRLLRFLLFVRSEPSELRLSGSHLTGDCIGDVSSVHGGKMSGDYGPNNDQVERFLSDLKGLPANAWGEVAHHAAHALRTPMYQQALDRMTRAIIESDRVTAALQAEFRTVHEVDNFPGLLQWDLSGNYKGEEEQPIASAAANASQPIVMRDLLPPDDVATLLYPFDMVLKPELRGLSRKAATSGRGCMPAAGLIILIGRMLMLRRSRVGVEVDG
jgi:hypothetical protein